MLDAPRSRYPPAFCSSIFFFILFDNFRLAMDNELGLVTRGGLLCMGAGIGSPFTSLLMFPFFFFSLHFFWRTGGFGLWLRCRAA